MSGGRYGRGRPRRTACRGGAFPALRGRARAPGRRSEGDRAPAQTQVFPALGLSPCDDAAQANQPAGAAALCGALLGVAHCYAGANIGAGPTVWTTLAPAAGATIVFFLCWLGLELGSRCSESIAADRDLAAGLRLGAFCIATGAILGRAAAGDWRSWGGTLRDLLRSAASALARAPQPDLAHTLRRWQDAGIAIWSVALDAPTIASPSPVPRPNGYGWAWSGLLALVGLGRDHGGGFGGPGPGSGGCHRLAGRDRGDLERV